MIIVAKNLVKNFQQAGEVTHVLKNINFTFSSDYSYALTGVSGSGKSTLLHLLCALDTPTSGSVTFTQTKANTPNFGVVFQDDYLIEQFTVLENIMLGGLAKKIAAKTVAAKALKLLAQTELTNKQNAYPAELSGGQRTRVAICRALICEPEFLFADEPTGNLDQENATKIIDLILHFQKEFGMGTIICTHDQKIFTKTAQVLTLAQGELF